MVGRPLSHYKILDEISRGGMGVVYRAVDTKLNREVAFKVLPADLISDPERKRRFLQEAQAAASLEHPHIATIYEVDEAEGVTFMVMELIGGDKLKDVIEHENLSLARVLDLSVEVAEGLARAHDKGIVHRDLKPANVMLTEDGHAKIIDFGLAKLVEPLGRDDEEAQTALRKETDPGIIMGTVAYMSPEQARGAKVDHRSDIFAFGIVLYEMLAGKPPFQGASGTDTLSSILRDPAPSLPTQGAEMSAELAADLQRIIEKCLAKEPNERYQGMKDVAVDLRTARRRLESGAVSGSVSGVSGPVAAQPPSKRWLWVGAAAGVGLLVAVLALFLRPSSRAPATVSSEKPSVAVLYFENNTGDPSLDWLRTALTNMLVTDLAQSPDVEVLGTDSLYQILEEMNRLDDRVTSLEVVQEVAERAGVSTVLLGNFVKAGETIRINVRLQEAATGRVITSEKVEGVGEDSIFPMVDDLTRRIKSKFNIPRTADAVSDQNVADVTTSSVEAKKSESCTSLVEKLPWRVATRFKPFQNWSRLVRCSHLVAFQGARE